MVRRCPSPIQSLQLCARATENIFQSVNVVSVTLLQKLSARNARVQSARGNRGSSRRSADGSSAGPDHCAKAADATSRNSEWATKRLTKCERSERCEHMKPTGQIPAQLEPASEPAGAVCDPPETTRIGNVAATAHQNGRAKRAISPRATNFSQDRSILCPAADAIGTRCNT